MTYRIKFLKCSFIKLIKKLKLKIKQKQEPRHGTQPPPPSMSVAIPYHRWNFSFFLYISFSFRQRSCIAFSSLSVISDLGICIVLDIGRFRFHIYRHIRYLFCIRNFNYLTVIVLHNLRREKGLREIEWKWSFANGERIDGGDGWCGWPEFIFTATFCKFYFSYFFI